MLNATNSTVTNFFIQKLHYVCGVCVWCVCSVHVFGIVFAFLGLTKNGAIKRCSIAILNQKENLNSCITTVI